MSAICGIYHRDGRPVTSAIGAAMLQKLSIYHADASGEWHDKSMFLGCHSQHVTPESVAEILPFRDANLGLTITADAIIDNREELLDKLDIAGSQRVALPDSLLILLAYRKWGRDCPKYLIGDFSFVIWDENKQCMFCAVDHRGTRTLYYFLEASGVFAFSTLIKPLLVLPEVRKEHNETWFADFLTIPYMTHQLDPGLTPYKDILLLPAGNSLTITADKVEQQVYWQVAEQPELKLKTNEYEEALREVLDTAISCRLRSIRPPGVMLSGGLDSTAIACMTARKLAKGGQRLEAFSAVPMTGYRHCMHESLVADETPYIEAVREYTGNIDVTYCRLDDRHSLCDTSRMMSILEQPYKIFENLFWIDGILASAREKNIGIMLQGGAGNVTMSWGSAAPCLLSLMRAGRWRSLLGQSWRTARHYRYPYSLKKLKDLFIWLLPISTQMDAGEIADVKKLSPVNPDFARQFSMEDRFRKFGFDPYICRMDAWEERKDWFRTNHLSHMGIVATKLSLANRIAFRDPTLDKRVIEFCLSVPVGQYVYDGVPRSLIRRAMKGIVPDKVRMNHAHGTQGADVAQRLQPDWSEIVDEIGTIGEMAAEQKYLDIKRIKNELDKHRILNDDAAKDSGWRMLIRSLIFSRYLRSEK